MATLTVLSAGGKNEFKTVVDEKGSKVIQYDKDGNEMVISECNK